jgi:tRNA-2-methylthio-N6-dimethylallyladenosine synthase
VPYTRGRERSRSPESIYNEVAELCQDGVKEITLLGQNVNSYLSESCLGQQMDFPALIHMLDTVPGLSRLRFMTSHPKDLSEGLVRAFSDCRSLCPSIHLPVQAGSSRVLARMNRGYTKEAYLDLVSRLRAEKPDIVLTTDLIVGFPGETDADFEDTMDVIEQARFDAAFTFMFSPRQGTPAANYRDQIEDETKRARFSRMVDFQNAISLERNKACVGRIESVLIEGESKTDKTALAGRTAGGKLVNIPQVTSETTDAARSENANSDQSRRSCRAQPHASAGIGMAALHPAGSANDPDVRIGQILDVQLLEAGTFSFIGRLI